MKIKSLIPGGLVLACVLAVSAASLSQDTEVIQDSSSNIDSASQVEPLPFSGWDVASFSSLSEAQLAALVSELDARPTLPTNALPYNGQAGTFWSLARPDSAPNPCVLPGVNVWLLNNGSFLLNDVNFNYQAASQRSLARGGMQPMELSVEVPDFGTNLYLAQMSLAAGYLTGIASNTVSGVSYEIMSNADLTATTNWNSTGLFIFGSEETNWTALGNLPMSLTNKMFFKLRSWADDGSGLPIWWQMAFFGVASGVDPYDDPAGDGWNNLQKFQNGWNPNTFYTPATPQVSAALNNNSGFADVNWLPSPGPVTGYTLKKEDAQTGLTTDIDLSADTQSFADDLSAETPLNWWTPQLNVTYSIQAHYPNGNSAWGAASLVTTQGPVAKLVSGPQGRLYVAMPGLPSDLSEVRIYRIAEEQTDLAAVGDYLEGDLLDALDFPLDDGFFEVSAADITNGVFMLPDSFAPPFIVHDFWVQTVRSNGIASTWTDVAHTFTANHPLVDARSQLKDNLRFLLRSATELGPFAFQVVEGNEASGYQRSTFSQPANCAYAGFYSGGFDELRPIHDNCFYRNFVFDPNNLAADGFLNTGCYYDNSSGGYIDPNNSSFLFITNFPAYFFNVADFITATDPTVPSSLLTANQTTWILPTGGDGYGNVAAGDRNFFGLPYLSVKDAYLTNSQLQLTTYNPGDAVPDGFCYRETAQPGFQAAGYYFARVGADPLPGQDGFAPTNATNPFIATVGNNYSQSDVTIAGYAKLAVTNGYSGVYAYLGQYFDQAYQIADNGVVTTNTTGILSPYGDFLPTQPGAAALVTLPDLDTGERGTCVVYSVSLQLDANHDGGMDLSFNGADATTLGQPFVFWANNNFDRSVPDADDDTNYEDDVKVQGCPYTPNTATPDCEYRDILGHRVIPTQRDLEDYARLWVCGVTSNLLAALPSGSTVTLSWLNDYFHPMTNNPVIDLFQAADSDGGMGYLTNSATAATQIDSVQSAYIGRIELGESLQLNANIFGSAWRGDHFIFCGVSRGSGQLVLTITDANSNVLAQSAVNIQIKDIKEMYERWTVGDMPDKPPTNTAHLATEELSVGASAFQYAPPQDTNTPYILFVHGWNMETWEKDRYAETAYKRLYWQGYTGRFGSFRWPTDNRFKGSFSDAMLQPHNYDDSEFQAWKSAQGLLNKLKDLNAEYPSHVYMLAHSMGNVVAGEALRLSGTNQVVNTYVASQAAIPAHMYDASVSGSFLLQFIYNNPLVPDAFEPSDFNYGPTTPNIYGNWLSGNEGGGAGQIFNFLNANDFALAAPRWCYDQVRKPDTYLSGWYGYDGTTNDAAPWNHFYFQLVGNNAVYFDIVNNLTNRYEVMAYAAEPRSTALGATLDVGNVLQNINLSRTTTPEIWISDPSGHGYSDHFWHSAEFRGNYWLQQGYWSELLGVEAFNLK